VPPAASPAPATDYSDMFEAPGDVTAEGTPYWTARPQTNVVPITQKTDKGLVAPAYVERGNASAVNVQLPAGYNAATAAHESDHTWQNSRNPDFVDNLRSMDSPGAVDAHDYDYGGVDGLKKNHPNLGYLNAEQQASIVGDLTKENMMLHPGMSKPELAAWDEKKAALERPIQQMQRIPPRPPPTMTSKADSWLATKLPSVEKFLEKQEGVGARPLQHLHDMLIVPPVPQAPIPQPEAPSVALGYANPSHYVRGGDDVIPTPAPRPPKRKGSH
jgi:hypothetical protein